MQVIYYYFVQESANVVLTGANEAVGKSRNLVPMLEKIPLADGDGELFSGDNQVDGVGTQNPPLQNSSENQK